MAGLAFLLTALAWSHEVDSWAPHKEELRDSTLAANAAFDVFLDLAAAEVPCHKDDDTTRRKLARAIRRLTARRMHLWRRPFFRGLGYGNFSGWVELSPSVHHVETGSEGVFRHVSFLDSPVLRLAGTTSSVRLGGVPFGTEKLDHFLSTGFSYARWSRWGEDTNRALRRGTRTERLFFGRLTSKAFSYADLEANWSGFQFYLGLLQDKSALQRDDAGCVVRVRGFDWSDWVETSWDEFQNPSAYGPRVSHAIRKALEPDRDAVCAAWSALPPRRLPQHTAGKTPPHAGPFGLEEFCEP